MATCGECFFFDPAQPNDDSGNCIVEPPRIYPIMGMQGGKPQTVLQNMYPSVTRDQRACRHHDARPRPVISVVRQMPDRN
jgi:hypothetical protein